MHVESSTTLDTAQRTVAASSKLVDVNRERQVGVEQHTEIMNAGRRLYVEGGFEKIDFRQISYFISEMIQDRDTVAMLYG